MKPQKPVTLNLATSAKALIVLRVVILSLFLGIVIIFQSNRTDHSLLVPVSIIIFTYLLTIIYSVCLKFITKLRVFCYIQIIGDLLIETVVILTTGGIDSTFSFLYILSIIAASIILVRPGNYITASLSSLLYSIVAYLEFNNAGSIIFSSSSAGYDAIYITYKLFLNIFAFYIVAYLSGYLGDKWRSTGIELQIKSDNLLELQRFHENIVKSISSGLITTDMKGHITSLNTAAENITGYTMSDILGTSIESFFPFIAKSPHLLSLHEEGEISSFRDEGVFDKKNNNTTFIGVSISSLKDEQEKNKGLIVIFQDLTDFKEMEKKVAKAERFAAIGQMSAGIAHEIRNPLASMSGSIQILQDELPLTETSQRLMEIILKEAARLDSIITQFLNYAKPETVTLTQCTINNLIKETVVLLKNSKTYNNKITVIINPCDTITAYVDIDQIKQVFINLFLNAFDAIVDEGYVIISAYYRAKNTQLLEIGQGNYCVITVTDTGKGMSKETQQNIFDPFFTTKGKGTGLGLALVYRIIENHKGTIEVYSRPGMGTGFEISLPEIQ